MADNHIRLEEMMLLNVWQNTPFDRDIWRMIIGEVLLAAAAEVPEIPDVEETVAGLLGDDPAIRQAYHGKYGLCFGGGWYRPDFAGYNQPSDVQRLAEYLASVDPDAWTVAEAVGDVRLCSDERREEFAFGRQAFKMLVALYCRARKAGQLIVCEDID
jgi:hypothetical protein